MSVQGLFGELERKFTAKYLWQKLGKYEILSIFATEYMQHKISLVMEERLIIAKNIKLMREASNYTQENVASFLGIGRSTYSNYESGDRELPLPCMEKLADFYGCDAYMLYEENENVVEGMLATAFRVDNLSPGDMEQIAAFKRVVKNSLMMDTMLLK